jgi:hypothetical protein
MVDVLCSLLILCIFKILFICLPFLNICYPKTECKYTRLFFITSSFVKIFSIHFTIFAFIKQSHYVSQNIKLIIADFSIITGIWQFTENIGNGFS